MPTFRRLHGWRAWMIGLGTIIGLIGGIATQWQLTVQFLPPPLAKDASLLMMVGFAAALAALGTSDTKLDEGPYREIMDHRRKLDALDRAGHERDDEVHKLQQQIESDRAVIANLNDEVAKQSAQNEQLLQMGVQIMSVNARLNATLRNRTLALA